MDSSTKKVLVGIGSVLVILYAIFQVYQVFSHTVQTETVQNYSVYNSITTTGVVVRNESVVPYNGSGYMYYTLQDGDRISKGDTLASVFRSQDDAGKQTQLDVLDDQIKSLKSIEGQKSSDKANLTSINTQLNSTWMALVASTSKSGYTDLSTQKAKLLALLNKQQITTGRVQSLNGRIQQLTSQRKQLASSFSSSSGTVTSPVAGYFISRCDGFENRISTSQVKAMMPDQVKSAIKDTASVPKNAIGKVIGDYEWYMVCNVSPDQSEKLKVGTEITLIMPFVSSQKIAVKVVASNIGADAVTIVFSCSTMSAELAHTRCEEVQIILNEYTGLRVPQDALYFNKDHESGVFVRVGNVIRFKKVKRVYDKAADGYSICEEKDDKEYLQLYDSIVIGGKDLYDGKIIR